MNPDIEAFVAAIGEELVFCQAIIRRAPRGFSLRHDADRDTPADRLRLVDSKALRALANFTEPGAFRPLKSAPNLPRGWRAELRNPDELSLALNVLYPGAVADWFAARAPSPPITHYREFTARQSGMYRITATLPDLPASAAAAACCHEEFCLKRRLWTVGALPCDDPARKSAIPCLEPCAVMLEFARRIARLEQGVNTGEPSDEAAGPAAECDFNSPENPRRLRFLLEKQRLAATPPA